MKLNFGEAGGKANDRVSREAKQGITGVCVLCKETSHYLVTS